MKNTSSNSITLRSILGFIALISAMVLSGCNTMEGVGEDTEAAGESIQDASR